jgi:hypothetical protein
MANRFAIAMPSQRLSSVATHAVATHASSPPRVATAAAAAAASDQAGDDIVAPLLEHVNFGRLYVCCIRYTLPAHRRLTGF